MWMAIFFVYVFGASGTALSVFRNQVTNQSNLLNVGVVALWPVYWALFLASMFHNRRRGG